jgi:hypothetical protein
MKYASIASIALVILYGITQAGWSADIPSMLDTDSPKTSQQWHAMPVFTVGDKIRDYTAPGRLDGIGAFAYRKNEVHILVNHELKANKAYSYKLANGTELTGARISFFDIRKQANKDEFIITNAGLAYDTIYDREAKLVSNASQINEENIQKFNRKKDCPDFVLVAVFRPDLLASPMMYFLPVKKPVFTDALTVEQYGYWMSKTESCMLHRIWAEEPGKILRQ